MPIINYLTKSDSLIALKDSNQSLSYAGLHQAVNDRVDFLNSLNVTRIALFLDNSIDWVLFDLASQVANLCLTPIPTFFSSQQAHHALSEGGIELIIVDHELNNFSTFHQEQSPFKGISLYFTNDNQLNKSEKHKQSPLIPQNTSKITFTSGSTGTPKGVCIDAKSQRIVAQSLVEAIDIKNPVHLSLLPLSTLLENIAGVYAPLLAEGTVVLKSEQERGFVGSQLVDHQKLLNLVSQIQPNSTILVPELLQFFLHAIKNHWQAPKSFEFIAVGGSKVSTKLLLAAAQAQLPVFQGYGLSEAISVVSLNTATNNRSGSCGQLLPHTNAHIENGELVITDNIFLGYLNQPDSWGATQVKTGDLVEFQHGMLTVKGRQSNIIINSFGRNISPEWVEAEFLATGLFKHFIVFGDAKPACVALFTLLNSATPSALVSQIINQINNSLPDYAQIHCWHVINEIDIKQAQLFTDNGRPKRIKIEKHFANQLDNLFSSGQCAQQQNINISPEKLYETA